eukprot:gnl/MRDRNA2_/MRDRNA2_152086_c0_seq1.p1 gnl/MRDRNA2_/MRDRNA2_152086_c0~~gnl/MRDRNA2_/MRDRNA2_152086_c0_seq1.p1  ORF type:complete len:1014 (+),score=212.25 gnl/MRDRNA2_/MRDRNA2_152086_c0_seq1:42-3044(+)
MQAARERAWIEEAVAVSSYSDNRLRILNSLQIHDMNLSKLLPQILQKLQPTIKWGEVKDRAETDAWKQCIRQLHRIWEENTRSSGMWPGLAAVVSVRKQIHAIGDALCNMPLAALELRKLSGSFHELGILHAVWAIQNGEFPSVIALEQEAQRLIEAQHLKEVDRKEFHMAEEFQFVVESMPSATLLEMDNLWDLVSLKAAFEKMSKVTSLKVPSKSRLLQELKDATQKAVHKLGEVVKVEQQRAAEQNAQERQQKQKAEEQQKENARSAKFDQCCQDIEKLIQSHDLTLTEWIKGVDKEFKKVETLVSECKKGGGTLPQSMTEKLQTLKTKAKESLIKQQEEPCRCQMAADRMIAGGFSHVLEALKELGFESVPIPYVDKDGLQSQLQQLGLPTARARQAVNLALEGYWAQPQLDTGWNERVSSNGWLRYFYKDNSRETVWEMPLQKGDTKSKSTNRPFPQDAATGTLPGKARYTIQVSDGQGVRCRLCDSQEYGHFESHTHKKLKREVWDHFTECLRSFINDSIDTTGAAEAVLKAELLHAIPQPKLTAESPDTWKKAVKKAYHMFFSCVMAPAFNEWNHGIESKSILNHALVMAQFPEPGLEDMIERPATSSSGSAASSRKVSPTLAPREAKAASASFGTAPNNVASSSPITSGIRFPRPGVDFPHVRRDIRDKLSLREDQLTEERVARLSDDDLWQTGIEKSDEGYRCVWCHDSGVNLGDREAANKHLNTSKHRKKHFQNATYLRGHMENDLWKLPYDGITIGKPAPGKFWCQVCNVEGDWWNTEDHLNGTGKRSHKSQMMYYANDLPSKPADKPEEWSRMIAESLEKGPDMKPSACTPPKRPLTSRCITANTPEGAKHMKPRAKGSSSAPPTKRQRTEADSESHPVKLPADSGFAPPTEEDISNATEWAKNKHYPVNKITTQHLAVGYVSNNKKHVAWLWCKTCRVWISWVSMKAETVMDKDGLEEGRMAQCPHFRPNVERKTIEDAMVAARQGS